MTAKSSDWRPGPSVCRCCFAEGCYKDISTEYFWMGKREVYQEMLSTTFDVSISYAQSGGPNSNSRLICEPCIARLRDASDFKRQVQECERVFHQHLDPTSSVSELEVVVEPPGKEVKLERVKVESKLSDDEDFDDHAFVDDDDDDLDDQPLTALATKVPKKESVDLMDLLDNAKPEKRKAAAKPKTPPAKKAKKKESPKPSASKPAPKPVEKKRKGSPRTIDGLPEKESRTKKKLFERSVNQNPQRQNAVLMLKHSTAIPFKTRFNRILCSYCHDEFEPMAALRAHIKEQHANADHNSAFYKVVDDLKIDITELKCNDCSQDIPNVDTLMTHLARDHERPVNFNVPFGVLPYRQGPTGLWMCLECDKNFSEFSQINGHLRTHIKIFTCDKCSATFLSEHGLRQHSRNFKCYNSTYKPRFGKALKYRSNTEIILECSTARPFRTWGQNFNCVFCRVQSNDPNGLRTHMTTRHANYNIQHVFSRKLRKEFLKVDITDLQCKLCFMAIDSLDDLMKHLKNDHKQPINVDVQPGVLPFKLRDGSCWQCAICSIQFTDFISLKKHTLEHYQNYVCDTCGEGFITESALMAHTKIPHDNKYNCSRCVATFSTLEERNIHIKTQHTTLPYMCNYCKDKPRFATWELRKRHLMEFHNYKPGAEMYECTTCHMTFKSRSQKYHHNVKAHRTKKETEYSFPCLHCSRAFATKMSLDKHIAKKHFHV
ncbi:zinc finger protein Xfin-like isoform X2 [Pectinophora gossypiella]|uniref:zinc finger protein Xfin-like isoform X2 n=1 Tax=Pectinophora gossypiella TaxID=13191 RepID=UPI00214ED06E|nr:zinc finger protein Xfin-like isoform X2 [Pectinophora gossypiella]